MVFRTRQRSVTRDRILALLEQHPGLHKAALAERMGIASSTVEFHLHRLQRQGAVHLLESRRETFVFPRGMNPEHYQAVAVLQSPGTRDVATELVVRGRVNIEEIHQALGVPRAAAKRRLNKLVDAGLAHRGDKKRDPFEAAQSLRGILEKYP